MTQLKRITDRYGAAAAIASGTVELHLVADSAGAHLDLAVRRLTAQLKDEDPHPWAELLAVARHLRWRLATNPVPPQLRAGGEEALRSLRTLSQRRRLAADEQTQLLLIDLEERAETACVRVRPTSDSLLESLADLNYSSCVVVAASGRTRIDMLLWFEHLRINVPVINATFRDLGDVVEQAYLIGWPSIFGSSSITAPRANALAFIMPSWVRDHGLPRSALADHAVGAVIPAVKAYQIGSEPVLDPMPPTPGDRLVPGPVWSGTQRTRRLLEDETLARKILLGGGYSIMLDEDGEHIRGLFPERPAGHRVELRDVSAVTVGSHLVLREGVTQSAMLYEWAIELLGNKAAKVVGAQKQWKQALSERVERLGSRAVVRALRTIGVRRADRVTNWTSITMVRPQDDRDFELLLEWLGFSRQPYFDLSEELRSARSRASHDVRELLEEAVSSADLGELERDGILRFELDIPGFKGIIASRVLAVSPHLEPVHRRDLRLPKQDWEAQWLE